MSDTTIDYESLLSVGLRGGGIVAIRPDRITSGDEVYLLAELRQAMVVSAPVPPNVAVANAGLVPALLLRMYDGRAPLFVPSDSSDASRLLVMIQRLRPEVDVEGNLEKSVGRPAPLSGHRSATGQGYAHHQVVQPIDIAASERVLAGLAHLSVFYTPLLLPFVLWLALRGGAPYASRQAKQAFFFHLLILVVVAVVIIPAWVVLVIGGLTLATASDSNGVHEGGGALSISSLVCGGVLTLALSVALAIYSTYGAVQAFNGKPFHYPLLRRL